MFDTPRLHGGKTFAKLVLRWLLDPPAKPGDDNVEARIRENYMTVYVDDAIWNWQGLKWCHLMADDVDELHRFAARLGVHRNSYQGPPRTGAPHYDLTSFERARAIALGAKACSRPEIVAVFRTVRHAGSKRNVSGGANR